MGLMVLDQDKFQPQAFTPKLPMISSLVSPTRLCLAFVLATAVQQVPTRMDFKLQTSWKVSKLITMESLLAMVEVSSFSAICTAFPSYIFIQSSYGIFFTSLSTISILLGDGA